MSSSWLPCSPIAICRWGAGFCAVRLETCLVTGFWFSVVGFCFTLLRSLSCSVFCLHRTVSASGHRQVRLAAPCVSLRLRVLVASPLVLCLVAARLAMAVVFWCLSGGRLASGTSRLFSCAVRPHGLVAFAVDRCISVLLVSLRLSVCFATRGSASDVSVVATLSCRSCLRGFAALVMVGCGKVRLSLTERFAFSWRVLYRCFCGPALRRHSLNFGILGLVTAGC